MQNETLRLDAHGRGYVMRWALTNGEAQAAGKIATRIRSGKPYEAQLLEHIYEQGFTGLAVDVGANIGNHTLWLAAVCGLRVAAFEPVPADLQVLRANVELNDLGDRITVYPVALGDRRGRATPLGKGQLDVGESRIRRGPIRVRTLDSLKLSDVSVVKIDVEGMEPSVLRGGVQTIRRYRPVIFTEAWTDADGEAIAEVLAPLGYAAGDVFKDSRNSAPVVRWEPPQ
jgi:FkbM family methyltransferase